MKSFFQKMFAAFDEPPTATEGFEEIINILQALKE